MITTHQSYVKRIQKLSKSRGKESTKTKALRLLFFSLFFTYTFLVVVNKLAFLTVNVENNEEEIMNDIVYYNRENKEVQKVKNNASERLEFVHISKTAGTTIEQQAYLSGINWGSCIWKKTHLCEGRYKKRHFPLNEDEIPFNFSGVPWHTPPHWLKPNPFKGVKTFTVVRNPYDRVISEYYCNHVGYRGDDKGKANVMNKWIRQKLSSPELMNKPHFLPQHYYVQNKLGENVIDHLVRYENLNQEFSELMKKYSLNITLANRANAPAKKTLSKANFTQKTINMINKIFKEDFELLGYSMMTSMKILKEK